MNEVKLKPTQILPLIMILIDLGAAAVCAWNKDYKKAVYWVAAAVLPAERVMKRERKAEKLPSLKA